MNRIDEEFKTSIFLLSRVPKQQIVGIDLYSMCVRGNTLVLIY